MLSPPDTTPKAPSDQTGFSNALLDPESGTPPLLRGRGDEIPVRRFNVYRNNVVVSLVDAIASTYPAVLALTGEEFFRAMAREFCVGNPPKSPVLIDYGGDFPAFVEGFPPAQSIPYLADVARIEWAYTRAWHAEDADPVAIGLLGEIPAEDVAQARFRLHPSVRVVRSRFPAVSIWADCTGRSENTSVDLAVAEDGLIVRPGIEVDVRILPPGGAGFISALAQGETLGDAAGHASETSHLFDLSSHLAGLFDAGCVAEIL